MSPEDSADGEQTPDETQVLTFTLGAETYCVAIEYVSEIVDGGTLIPLPESATHVEGVMDLRGEMTTIVNPFEVLGTETKAMITDGGQTDNRIVVLDAEAVGADAPTGWLVSDVHDVRTISDDLLDTDAIRDSELLRGVISEENDDGFTLWVNPQQLLA